MTGQTRDGIGKFGQPHIRQKDFVTGVVIRVARSAEVVHDGVAHGRKATLPRDLGPLSKPAQIGHVRRKRCVIPF